ncbi:MAG: phosphoribosylformylglycinamidine cyclo-ligase [Ignavibacteriales bacterium]|nr:phosphoribosylformylglycinamidine cyclo-ligase [Ignavibacteriales bacterium]
MSEQTVRTSYKEAGVDIDAGEELVRRIKTGVRSTFSRHVLADIGMFGGLFRASFGNIHRPVLVSSVDGVGTKLKVAFAMNRHHTVGQDLVNHCVNDILACGAKPLFFMDYFATGKLNPSVGEQVIQGFIKACKENKSSLIGGETAEMPGMYADGEYDLAGTIVGVVEESKILTGKKIRAGDILVGLPSTGLHTNGYSLARAALLNKYSINEYFEELGTTLGDALMRIHRSYLKSVFPLLSLNAVHAISHITGGGIRGNTMRVIPRGLGIRIDWHAWERPALFRLIQTTGGVPEEDMRRTFNLGIGLVLIIDAKKAGKVVSALRRRNEQPVVMGEVVKEFERKRGVR